jgi:hypothetical protein
MPPTARLQWPASVQASEDSSCLKTARLQWPDRSATVTGINTFTGIKCCPSVLEAVGIRVSTRNIRNFAMFRCSFGHYPSVRCVSAANEEIFLITHVWLQKALADSFFVFVFIASFFFGFFLCCLIAAFRIRADCVTDHWLLSSTCK